MKKDVVVIGGGVGGLSAAVYARLDGHSVSVLEASDRLGGKAAEIQVDSFRLDPGPSIIILPRLYEQFFRDAGRQMAYYLRFQRLDPISRVYFGREAPIDLPADRKECERLVSGISQSDGEQFSRLMQKLDRVSPHIDKSIFARPFDKGIHLLNADLMAVARYFDIRKPYKSLVDGWFQSPLLRAFFYGFPSYGGQTYDSKAPGALLIPYLMIQEGVYYPEGGVGAIPKAIERLARELGVEFRFGSKVVRLETKGDRVSSAVLADGTTVDADCFVSGVDRLTTKSWLGDIATVSPSFSYFTLQWGLKRKVSGLKHHTLLIPEAFEHGFESLYRERKFPTPPIVYLNETTDIDPSCAPPGCSNLFAVVTSPSNEAHIHWDSESDKYRVEVLKTMTQFGFEIKPRGVVFERIQTPIYFQQQHGNYRGSLYGPDEAHRLFGMLPQRNYDERYRNLLYSGGSVQPGAGLPMVLLSGKFAAEKI